MFNCNPSEKARSYFLDKIIFITGATGFLGQALLHKLLSLSEPPKAVYVLVREKRGVDSRQRLRELLQSSIFETLRRQHGSRLESLVQVVTGDITAPELGLSPADRKLLCASVQIVFHSAATVRFDELLTKSVCMNIEATKSMLDLAKAMVRLTSFVHVSTAYSQCQKEADEPIEEEIYPVLKLSGPQQLIKRCKQDGAEQILNSPLETQRLVGKRPNTYTFTKALAEQLIEEEREELPISIVRPSIVVAAHEEPTPGWITNLNGPTGLIAGAGTGLLRTYHCSRSKVADLVPVDIVINLMCAAAANPPSKLKTSIPIYNCTSGLQNPITWEQIENWTLGYIRKHPMQDMFWYPGGSFKNWHWLDQLCQLLFHFLPAYILDAGLRITGRERFFVSLYTRMSKVMGALEFFATRQWIWKDGNTRGLWLSMDEEDRQTFSFDIQSVKWKPFLERYVLGTRKYVLKSSPDTLPESRKKLKQFRVMHWMLQGVFFLATAAIGAHLAATLGLY